MGKYHVWAGLMRSWNGMRKNLKSCIKQSSRFLSSEPLRFHYLFNALKDLIAFMWSSIKFMFFFIRRFCSIRFLTIFYVMADIYAPGLVFPNVIFELKAFMCYVVIISCTIIFMMADGYDFDVCLNDMDKWMRLYWRLVYKEPMSRESTDKVVRVYRRLRFDRNFYFVAIVFLYFLIRIRYM